MKKRDEYWTTDAGNCRGTRCGDITVLTLGPGQWDDAEWADFLGVLNYVHAGATPLASVTYVQDVVTTSTQRKQIAELSPDAKQVTKRVALLTDSLLVRGTLTAFGWLIPGPLLRTFAVTREDLDVALTWTREVATFDVSAAQRALLTMVRDGRMKAIE